MRPDPSDPRQDGGEWIFKKGGQVFGPVPAHTLVQMLYRGEVDGSTPVAGDDGAYRPLGQVAAFVVHARKAEAQLKVEREVTGARALARRRSRLKAAAAVALAVAVLGGGGYGAWWLATSKPWIARSALLEDFGGGIAIASPARIGGSRRASADVEVDLPPGEPSGARRPARPAAPSGSASGGELVAEQFDTTHIQAIVAREQRTLAPCLRAEAQRSPGFAGDVPLEFAIGNDGRVAQLWIDEPRFKRGELHECLFRTLRTWAFKPFPGTRPTVSLSFRIGTR